MERLIGLSDPVLKMQEILMEKKSKDREKDCLNYNNSIVNSERCSFLKFKFKKKLKKIGYFPLRNYEISFFEKGARFLSKTNKP